MTPAARLAAAIEVLDRLAAGRASADETLAAWGRNNRYAGSGDRRAVGGRVYAVLRERGRLAQAAGSARGRDLVLASLALQDGLAAAEIAAMFSGQGHAPAPLSDEEQARLEQARAAPPAQGLPPFIAQALERSFGADWEAEAQALLGARAPLDLRVNTVRATRDAVLAELAGIGMPAEPTPLSATGLRLATGTDVQALDLFKSGRIEVQDEGSQLAAWLAGAEPGMTVVDYCAGGGGKTLALAQAMAGGEGRLVACDTEARRLDAIQPRLARAGVRAELRRMGAKGEGAQDLRGEADLVLVDAPCSGSGVWRRRPEQAWRLTESELAHLAKLQGAILARACALVKPGGRLAYVTCSVLASENAGVTTAFAGRHRDFEPRPVAEAAQESAAIAPAGRDRLSELAGGAAAVQLSPRRTATDGFFIALFERKS